MTINIKRLRSMDALIRAEATGTPEIFAEKLNVSVSTVFRDLKFMKKLGAPIDFNYLKRSYYYKNSGRMRFVFVPVNI